MNIVKRIFRRINYDYCRLKDLIIRNLCKPPKVINTLESAKYIEKNNCSCSRFGDGELLLIYGYDLGFQEYHPLLANRLCLILSSQPNNNTLICIPNIFKSISFNYENKRFWMHHLYYKRSEWYKLTNRKYNYGDAFISRFYSMRFDQIYSSKVYNELRKIWDNRNIVFIEGQFSRLGVGNDCFSNAKSIKRIIAPAKNAFNKYDEILNFTKTQPKDTLFILALGPTATIMAYDLAQCGYQALDLGHIDLEYEWYKMGVTEKKPIAGKFCNETFITGKQKKEIEGELPQTELEKYYSQIIYNCCNN